MSNDSLTTILAIESSCDETAAAIVTKQPDEELVTILAETTATSLAKHQSTKGIVPEVAAREQVKVIVPVIQEVVKGFAKENLDAIAVTTQPGLIGSLLVGVEAARTLAATWGLPIIPVNHVEAHLYANFISKSLSSPPEGEKVETTVKAATRERGNSDSSLPTFPFLSWVISGGHTQLRYYESHHKNQLLGETRDDAVGECLDKCARVLGGDYPGGPLVEHFASHCDLKFFEENKQAFTLPRPLINETTLDVSFSGLKTAFVRKFEQLKKNKQFDNETIKHCLSHELQNTITDVLIAKTEHALAQFPQTRSIIISGGVTANKFLQLQFQNLAKKNHLGSFSPPLNFSTDNAVMIGAYALFHPELQTSWENVEAQPKSD